MAECSQKSFFSPSSTALQKNFTEEEEHFKKAVYEVVNNIENDLLSNGNTSDENAKDLKNVEFKIQSDRILKVLDMAIEKIEIAFCLPFISDNWNDNKVTDEQKMISYLCEKLGGNDGLDKLDAGIQLNQAFTSCINNVHKQGFYNLVPQFIKEIPEPAQHFLTMMRDLRSVAELRIAMTAPREMAKEKVLHKMWTDNSKTREKVMELQAELQSNEFKLQLQLDEKKTKLSELQETRDHLNEENRGNIEREIHVSSRLMNKNCIESKDRQNELFAELTLVKEGYQTLLQNNIKADKNLREEKTRVIQKLQSWIAKYDADVGERNQLLYQLNGDLDVANQTLLQWQKNFDTQDVIYKDMMKAKEEEENRIRDEKLILFMMNRAAALIQRAWRKMLKARKGKKKKGKKKK